MDYRKLDELNKLDSTWITHEEIMNGGELKFVLSTRP